MTTVVVDCVAQNIIPTNKPGAEPKRPGRPVNITHLFDLTASVVNNIIVWWNVEENKVCAALFVQFFGVRGSLNLKIMLLLFTKLVLSDTHCEMWVCELVLVFKKVCTFFHRSLWQSPSPPICVIWAVVVRRLKARSLENARSSQKWIGPIQYFSAETDRRFSTSPVLGYM